ncbi:MAG: hypothetical protein KDB90_07455 [Planctomycetes bacterium]|nr:hypothetical protein [Planctomycetota bacterium]
MKSLLLMAGVCSLLLSSIVIAQDAPAEPEIPKNVLHETFDKPPEEPAWTLRKHAQGNEPVVKDGKLQLLTGAGDENNSAAWPVQVDGGYRRVKAELVFSITPEARGMSFMLLHTSHFARKGAAFYLYKAKGFPGDPKPAEPEWDEPNLWGSFAVALDTHNPPSEDPFDANGNVHERPQREVSLHFDGREVANAFCEPDFVTGKAAVLAVEINFLTGGAEVTVGVGGQAIYDHYFIPHMQPYESRAAVGAHGDAKSRCDIDSLHVEWENQSEEVHGPLTLQAVKSGWSRPGKPYEGDVHLMPTGHSYERVIMTLRLKPMVERDEWDRLGHVWVWDNEDRFELARILTPFQLWGETYEYVCDVSDFGHLLDGARKIGVDLGANVGNGFAFDLEFSYYRHDEGVAWLPKVVKVQNVWSGNADFKSEDSLAKTFGKRTVKVPADAKRAKLRICVTGHGTLEFTPLGRTVKVGENVFKNELWTTDCYLNPWRPQFGTWKYNRAGWGPGSFGRVWEIDVSSMMTPGKELSLEYTSAKFNAEGKWASHRIESQIVFYAE